MRGLAKVTHEKQRAQGSSVLEAATASFATASVAPTHPDDDDDDDLLAEFFDDGEAEAAAAAATAAAAVAAIAAKAKQDKEEGERKQREVERKRREQQEKKETAIRTARESALLERFLKRQRNELLSGYQYTPPSTTANDDDGDAPDGILHTPQAPRTVEVAAAGEEARIASLFMGRSKMQL